jgi:hypothetical protein
MNENNCSKINWSNIAFDKEFQNYLNVNTLKEISMVSKPVRIKLSSNLFYKIKLEPEFKYDYITLEKYYKFPALSAFNRLINSDKNELEKDLGIKMALNDIKSGLGLIKRFVSNLFFYQVGYHEYHLFSTFNCLDNLTILKLYYSNIPYSAFVKFGVSFPKLEVIKLSDVTLIKLHKDSTNSEDFVFPLNLNYLGINNVAVTEKDEPFNSYEILSNDLYTNGSGRFILPNLALPNLKKLKFIDMYEEEDDLKEFLDKNPNLELLSVKSLNLGKVYNFKLLKSLKFGI